MPLCDRRSGQRGRGRYLKVWHRPRPGRPLSGRRLPRRGEACHQAGCRAWLLRVGQLPPPERLQAALYLQGEAHPQVAFQGVERQFLQVDGPLRRLLRD